MDKKKKREREKRGDKRRAGEEGETGPGNVKEAHFSSQVSGCRTEQHDVNSPQSDTSYIHITSYEVYLLNISNLRAVAKKRFWIYSVGYSSRQPPGFLQCKKLMSEKTKSQRLLLHEREREREKKDTELEFRSRIVRETGNYKIKKQGVGYQLTVSLDV